MYFLLAISCQCLYGQNCIDYGTFDDPTCGNCAPSGWSTVNFGPEIENPGTGCTGIGASPSGGTYAALQSNTGHDEAIETTVSGLTPGASYNIAFWYFSEECGGGIICCSPLLVFVDGLLFEFPSAPDDWTLAEMCVEATGTTMHIQLESALGETNQSWLFIDDAQCQGTGDCCSVFVDLQNEDEVCPNQILQFNGLITDATGPVDIVWSSDPPDGVDYLSDLSIIDPTFLFPSIDPEFEGTTYEFEVSVIDGDCEAITQIDVTVFPHVAVQFEFDEIYCQNHGEIYLPNISNDGFTGVWQTPVINTNDWPGQTVSNVFIPDPDQSGCPAETNFEFQIQPYVFPEFDFPLYWCRWQFTSFEFPNESVNGVEGFWDLQELIPEDHSDGIIELIFTPDDLFCSDIANIAIELTSGDPLSFDLPETFCTEEGIIDLPDQSLNGIEGEWSEMPLDVTHLSGPQSITFVPMDEDCYQPYEYLFDVVTFGPVTFETINPICSNSGIITLDEVSQEGYDGFWSQATFNIDTFTSSTFTSTWTALPGQVNCPIDTTLTFDIVDPAAPEFDLPNALCISDEVFNFPTHSIDSIITGSWSIASIDPGSTGATIIQSTFTPDDSLCALPLVWDIEVTDLFEPVFSLPTMLCETDVALTLNNISDNGIEGQWTNQLIDPSISAGQIIESIFTPLQENSCSDSVTITIEVIENMIPEFNLPDHLCWSDDDFTLPLVSENGISGVWNNNTIDIEENLGSNVNIEFVPDMGICAEAINLQIQIVDVFNVTALETDPSSCNEANGKIEISGDLDNLEFSIDDGSSWQINPCFENLTGGVYEIQVRSELFPDCLFTIFVELEAVGSPQIISVITEDETGCNAHDGMITIDASGMNLEYTIDGGISWVDENIFLNLNPGNYTVAVRESGIDDCITVRQVEIEAFPLTVLLSVETMDLTDCFSNDGEIVVLAQGQNLEYSIDDGISWQDSGSFINLSEGVYEIIVRSIDDTDCLERQSITLLAPDMPTITSIDISHPGNCHPDAGTISIIANGNDLEYSIDNGLSWQMDNTFVNLSQGTYDVVVRERSQPNCTETDRAVLVEESEILMDVQLEIIEPSACMTDDAQIIINSVETDIELSYDQGITWQRDLIIDNLASGQYTIIVRHVQYVNCLLTLEALIEDVDCPCADLIINANVTPMYCVDQTNGSIEITNVLGQMNDDYDIIWDTGEMGDMLNNLSGGWYPFTILYDDDCMWRDSVFVEQIDPLNFNLTTYDPNCPGTADGAIEITEISGGNGNFTYSLDGIEYQTSNVFVDLSPSEYQVFVLDDQQCLQSQFVELLSHDPIEIDFPQILPIELGETVYLNPLIDQMSIDSFEWEPHPSIINPGQLIAEVAPHETTSYTLSIFYGLCIEVRIITVEVTENEDIYLANIFSLDSQDGNTVLFIQADTHSNIVVNSFSIYDRWGNLMFTKENPEINDPDHGWNGYYNNYKVQGGVYVYVVEYVKGGEVLFEVGGVTLVY